MKRSVFFLTLLIGMISFVSITSCQGLPGSSTGTPVASFASYPSSVLGVVIDPTGKVLDVEPGSSAEQAGIARDDVLQEVNNLPVNSEREQVRTTIRESKKDQILSVKLKRNGNEVLLNVKPSAPAPRAGKATPTPVSAPLDYL
jgi:S1-C subfamily serine protease